MILVIQSLVEYTVHLKYYFFEIKRFLEEMPTQITPNEALLTAFAIQEQIINLLPGSVYWKTIDDRILGCNNSQAAVFNQTPKEMVGKTSFELLPEDAAKKLVDNDQLIISTDKIEVLEESAFIDGKTRTYLSQKQPLKDHDGKIIGILGVSFDITIQKEVEALRQEKTQMEIGVKNLKALSSSIAHEFKTPLATVKLGFEHIQNMLPPLIQFAQATQASGRTLPDNINIDSLQWLLKYLDQLNESIKGFEVITQMLLTNIRGIKNKPEQLKLLSINEVVSSALRRYPFKRNDPPAHNKIGHNDFMLNCNKDLLSHVLFNLIKNAIEAIKEAGKGEITITAKTTPNYNELIFTDTGPGIEKAKLSTVFEKFYTESASGSGLGLSICQEALKHAKGEILCKSEYGEYTSFIMRFPI